MAAVTRALRRIAFIASHDTGMRRKECIYLDIWNEVGIDSNLDKTTAVPDVLTFLKYFDKKSQVLTFDMNLGVIWQFQVF